MINNMSFEVQPSVSKNLCNCTLTSKGRSSSQSFLRSSSWVIILKFGLNKIFHFFVNSKYTVTIPLITKMFSLSLSLLQNLFIDSESYCIWFPIHGPWMMCITPRKPWCWVLSFGIPYSLNPEGDNCHKMPIWKKENYVDWYMQEYIPLAAHY